MCIAHKGNDKWKIVIEGQQVEQVTQFKYVGNIMSCDGYYEKDTTKQNWYWVDWIWT